MKGDASGSTPYLGVRANLLANVRPFARGEKRIPTRAAWDSVLNNPEKENELYSIQKRATFPPSFAFLCQGNYALIGGRLEGFLGYSFWFKVIESGYFFTDK
jgi:hypothetical protein